MMENKKNKTEQPLLSVIMSVYNGEKYLQQAIESILQQSYDDFEFLIYNDGSSDNTQSIINKYNDPRIILTNQKNIGLTKTLNLAIKKARGKYIARMDADDIAEPNRFEKQILFLENNPDILLCGSQANIIDEKGNFQKKYTVPLENKKIKKGILLHNPFIHSTIIFKKELIEKIGDYNENFKFAQDYELWTRVIAKFKTANLPDCLLNYRIYKNNITHSNNLMVRFLGIKIRLLALWRLYLKGGFSCFQPQRKIE